MNQYRGWTGCVSTVRMELIQPGFILTLKHRGSPGTDPGHNHLPSVTPNTGRFPDSDFSTQVHTGFVYLSLGLSMLMMRSAIPGDGNTCAEQLLLLFGQPSLAS